MDDQIYNQGVMKALMQQPGANDYEAPMTAHERLQMLNRAQGGPYSMASMHDLPERFGLGMHAVQDALGEQTRSPISLPGGSNKFDPEMPREPLPPNADQAAMSRQADALAAAKMRKPMEFGINQAQHPGMNVDPQEQLGRDDWGGVGNRALEGAGYGALNAGALGLVAGLPGAAMAAPFGATMGGAIGGLGGLSELISKRRGRDWMKNP